MLSALRNGTRRVRIILGFGVLTLAALIFLACGSGTVTAGGDSSTSATPKPQAAAKVGSTITVDDVACTLMSAKTIAGDDFMKPKAGNVFVVVRVKIVNKSNSEFDYNPYDFHAKSGSGNITDVEVPPSTYTANNQLDSGKLSAGGSVEGDMVFQVPQGDHKAALTWQPSIFGNAGDNAWNLGL